jgi:hypothetical protein
MLYHTHLYKMIVIDANRRRDPLQQDDSTCHHAPITLSHLFRSSVYVNGCIYPRWLRHVS